MVAPSSIFFDFNLPNASTWFYFSFLLAMALFFKFSRLLSVRNWDVVMVFLLVPGLLLLQEARPNTTVPEKHPATAVSSVAASVAGQALAMPATGLTGVAAVAKTAEVAPSPVRWFGYLWLLCGSVYFLVRCLSDLALVRRPALAPNLSFGGLAWLGATLFICLVAVAFRQPDRGPNAPVVNGRNAPADDEVSKIGKESVAFELAQQPFERWVLRGFALLCHLACVAGLVLVGRLHFQDGLGGMAAATFYLILPYTGHHVGQAHHVWPAALLVWALVAYRKPMIAGSLLGLAAGTAYFPALLFPLWFSFYWRRGAGRFAAAFVLMAGL